MKFVFWLIIVATLVSIVLILMRRQSRSKRTATPVQKTVYPFLDRETIDYVVDVVSKQPHETLNLREFAVPIWEGKYRAMAISLQESSCKGDPKLIMCAVGAKSYVHWGLLSDNEANAVMGAALQRIRQLKGESTSTL
jgi:hypothetical protein